MLIRAWKGNWQDPDFHHAAGINLDAAKWLIEAGMKSVGIDPGNIEDNAVMSRQVHLYLLEQGTAIYENLANLGNLPVKRFTFAGFPLSPPLATDRFMENNPPDSPSTRAILENVPLARIGTPQDVADAVAFLSSDEAGFITGQSLYVCGGLTI